MESSQKGLPAISILVSRKTLLELAPVAVLEELLELLEDEFRGVEFRVPGGLPPLLLSSALLLVVLVTATTEDEEEASAEASTALEAADTVQVKFEVC